MTTDAVEGGRYFAADAEADDELARLKLLEALCDPWTFRHLDGIGVRQGWRCLEVGAGAGSVVRWLSERVGPTGKVVAADLDPRFLGDISAGNVEVRRCDITQDDIEPASYDLVHCRALLMQMDDPADVLRRMATALRPGGWLVAEDGDFGTLLSRLIPPTRWPRPSTPASAQESSFSRRRTSWISVMAGCCRFTWNRSGSSSWGTRSLPG
jgi:SAM-dependent methyltransferase